MDELILKIIEEQRDDIFAKIRLETDLYYKVRDFYLTYGVLPTIETAKQWTSVTSWGEPLAYYLDEYESRVVMEKTASTIAEINKLFTKNKAKEAVGLLRKLVEEFTPLNTQAYVLHEAIEKYIEEIKKHRMRSNSTTIGISTGWPSMDKTTTGLQPGDLGLIVGRAKQGKTTLLLHMLKHVHTEEIRSILFISMEMSIAQVVARLLAMYAKLKYRYLRDLRLSDLAINYVREMVSVIKSELPPLYLVEGSFEITTEKLRVYIKETNPEVVFIDGGYLLKLVSIRKNASSWEIGQEIANELKRIALLFNVPIVATFQLNREATKKKQIGLEHIHLTDALSANCSWAYAVKETDNPSERNMICLGSRHGFPIDFVVNYDFGNMDFSEIHPLDGSVDEEPYYVEEMEYGEEEPF